MIEQAGFGWHPLPEVPWTWDFGRWYPTAEDLTAAVRAHAALIERLAPDAAIIDSSVPARIACEAAALDDLSLNHFLPAQPEFRRRRDLWGRHPRLLLRPRRALKAARLRLGRNDSPEVGVIFTPEPSGRAALISRINEVRASLGLSPVASVTAGAWNAKIVACPTTPFLDPTRRLPPSARYVGPVSWSGTGDGPPPRRGERPLIFVSQGSTGHGSFLRRTVEALASEPVDVAVATAGLCDPEELTSIAPNVLAHPYLPHRPWLETADAAVIHGGQMTAGDAHRAGTPLAVLPAAGDQIVSAWRVERLGIGISLWPAPDREEIARAVRGLLSRARYRRRAERVASRLRTRWDGARNAADLAEKLTQG